MNNTDDNTIYLTDEPLPITDKTITLNFHNAGKTAYQIPEGATAEERHFWTLLNKDEGGWDALIDAKIAEGADDEKAFLEVVQADPVLKAAFDAAFPSGIE